MLSAFGHSPTFAVRRFAGDAEFDGQGTGSLDLRIESDSLDLMDDVSPRDRKEMLRALNQDLLETSRFPVIEYSCPVPQLSARPMGLGRFDITLNGTLTLHGVSRSQPILAHVVAGEGTLRSYGELAVRRSDYGLRDVATAGNMIRLKDDVKLAFDIVARRQ